jgi:hypothetical protein
MASAQRVANPPEGAGLRDNSRDRDRDEARAAAAQVCLSQQVLCCGTQAAVDHGQHILANVLNDMLL